MEFNVEELKSALINSSTLNSIYVRFYCCKVMEIMNILCNNILII